MMKIVVLVILTMAMLFQTGCIGLMGAAIYHDQKRAGHIK
jgi:hypothetical protein